MEIPAGNRFIQALMLACTAAFLVGCGGNASTDASENAVASGSTAQAASTRTAPHPHTHEQKGKQVLFWTDPMVPGSHFSRPGKSPFMDMALVPVYAGSPGIVDVSESQQKRLGTTTTTVKSRNWYGQITTEGNITYDERNVHDITIRVNGRVSKYFPFHSGLLVKKGRPLYKISSPEVYTYLSHYLRLRQNAQKINNVSVSNSHIIAQSKTTLRWRGIPEKTIKHVLDTGQATDHFIVRAPVTGMVISRTAVQGSLINAGVKTGQFVTYGQTVAKIADISFVYVNARLWANQMHYVKPGMKAIIEPQGTKKAYVAKINYVYPVLKVGRGVVTGGTSRLNASSKQQLSASSASSGTSGSTSSFGPVQQVGAPKSAGGRFGIARIALDNPDFKLKPGMYAKVRINVPEADNVLAVPRNAVTYLPDQRFVYVKVDATHFQRRKVKVGTPVNGWVPVIRGLKKGEQVVTNGTSFFLYAVQALKNR